MKKVGNITGISLLILTAIGLGAYMYYPKIFSIYPFLTSILSIGILINGVLLIYGVIVVGKIMINSVDQTADKFL